MPAVKNLNYSPVHFRLGFQENPKHSPASICNRSGQLVVLQKSCHIQIFDPYRLVLADESSAEFVREVQPFISDLGMALGYQEPSESSVPRGFVCPTKARCSLLSFFNAERRNLGGAIFSPSRVTAREAKPRSTPTAL